MEILRSISLYCELKGLPFLIIGGHAINAYGIARHTSDIDFMVPEKDREAWLELMAKLNYSIGQNDTRYSRHRPKNLDNWPIDLMYVNQETFSALYESSVKESFGEAVSQVVSLEHLIYLKLHAFKNISRT
jgi:hypothetical protein